MTDCACVEVSEDPQLSRARGARQQPPKTAIQERTQECMTAAMNEGIAPCGGPGGASFAKGSWRKAATGGLRFKSGLKNACLRS